MKFKVEINQAFGKKYCKVYLKNQNDLIQLRSELINIDEVKNINVTENQKFSLTIHPRNENEIDILKEKIQLTVSNFYKERNSKLTPIQKGIIGSLIIMLLGVFVFTPIREIITGERQRIEFDFNFSATKVSKTQLGYYLAINNNSDIEGTQPQALIRIYGLNIINNLPPWLLSYEYFNKVGENLGPYKVDDVLWNSGLHKFYYSTNSKFRELTLYANDEIKLTANTISYPTNEHLKYLIARVDCWLKEGEKYSKTYLFNIDEIGKSKTIKVVPSKNYAQVNELLELYLKLNE